MVRRLNSSRMKTLNIYRLLCDSPDGIRESIYKRKMITYIMNINDKSKSDIFFESEEILFLQDLPQIVINNLLNYAIMNKNTRLREWIYSDNNPDDEYFLNYEKNKREFEKNFKEYILN